MKNFKNIQSILGGYFAFCITVFEASDIFIEKLKIEGDYFNYILLFLIIVFVVGGFIFYYNKSKANQKVKNDTKPNGKHKIINIFLIVSLFSLFGYYAFINSSKNDLIEKELPELIELFENNEVLKVYKKTLVLKEKFPKNKIILKYYKEVTDSISINTGDKNYDIFFKINNDSLSQWKSIGTSPNLERVPYAR